MRVPLHWCAWLAALSLEAATVSSDQEKLRSLFSLPRFTCQFGIGITSREGLALLGDEPDASNTIARLQKILNGQPGDGPCCLQLARAYDRVGEAVLASNALARAIAIGRQQVEQQPGSSIALMQLAEAVSYEGSHQEAEALFRRAVAVAPGDWHCLAALGQFLGDRAGAALFEDGEHPNSLSGVLAFLAQKRLPAAAVNRCQDLLSEGGEHLDKAVSLAPDDADARLARIKFRGLAELFRLFVRVGQGEEPDARSLLKAVAPITTLPDLRRAIELRPDDPQLAAIGAYFDLFLVAANRGATSFEELVNGTFYQSLSDSEQRALRNKLQRLEALGQSSNPTNASAALEYLGGLQVSIMRDYAGAERNLRRAVVLDAGRWSAWDVLLASLSQREKHEQEFLAVAEDLVKVRPTSRNFVILAKACDGAGRPDRALDAAVKAVRADTNSFLAHHTLAVVMAMSARDDNQFRHVLPHFELAGKMVIASTPAADVAQFFLNAACCCGLAGNYADGLKLIGRARHIDPKDTDAEEAEKILRRMRDEKNR